MNENLVIFLSKQNSNDEKIFVRADVATDEKSTKIHRVIWFIVILILVFDCFKNHRFVSNRSNVTYLDQVFLLNNRMCNAMNYNKWSATLVAIRLHIHIDCFTGCCRRWSTREKTIQAMENLNNAMSLTHLLWQANLTCRIAFYLCIQDLRQ